MQIFPQAMQEASITSQSQVANRCNFALNGYYYNLNNLNSQYRKVANRCKSALNGYYILLIKLLNELSSTICYLTQYAIYSIAITYIIFVKKNHLIYST